MLQPEALEAKRDRKRYYIMAEARPDFRINGFRCLTSGCCMSVCTSEEWLQPPCWTFEVVSCFVVLTVMAKVGELQILTFTVTDWQS